NISADEMTIDATSTIDLDERGYRGGLSTGNASYFGEGSGGGAGSNCFGCSVASGGGGHGGKGANGTGGQHSNAGGAAFGAYEDPITMGSGGGATGSGTSTAMGGDGGGLVIITVSGTFLHEGLISANGGSTSGTQGGGAGGGISITAHSLTGSGTIRANGGVAGNSGSVRGGSGAGGRIALVATGTTVSSEYTVQAYAGEGTGNIAGAGTIYKKDAGRNPDLVIDANGRIPLDLDNATPLVPVSAFGNVSILNEATLTARFPFIMDELTIDNGTFLSAINTAHMIGATTVVNGGNMTVPVRTSTTNYSLRIEGETISLDATSSIDLNGRGFRGGWTATMANILNGEGNGGGVGASCFGCPRAAGGGGHGGKGAGGTGGVNGAGGGAYGSIIAPVEMGSGRG